VLESSSPGFQPGAKPSQLSIRVTHQSTIPFGAHRDPTERHGGRSLQFRFLPRTKKARRLRDTGLSLSRRQAHLARRHMRSGGVGSLLPIGSGKNCSLKNIRAQPAPNPEPQNPNSDPLKFRDSFRNENVEGMATSATGEYLERFVVSVNLVTKARGIPASSYKQRCAQFAVCSRRFRKNLCDVPRCAASLGPSHPDQS
jgi:hypothetical protein